MVTQDSPGPIEGKYHSIEQFTGPKQKDTFTKNLDNTQQMLRALDKIQQLQSNPTDPPHDEQALGSETVLS